MSECNLGKELSLIYVSGLNGEHSRNEVFNYVKQAPLGMIIEVHVPHEAQPLVGGLKSFGLNVITDQLEIGHYRLMTVKLG